MVVGDPLFTIVPQAELTLVRIQGGYLFRMPSVVKRNHWIIQDRSPDCGFSRFHCALMLNEIHYNIVIYLRMSPTRNLIGR